jgi:hypothetical protein
MSAALKPPTPGSGSAPRSDLAGSDRRNQLTICSRRATVAKLTGDRQSARIWDEAWEHQVWAQALGL